MLLILIITKIRKITYIITIFTLINVKITNMNI
nr:MAG TPA: hypothetical protein [Crassvirales sp.]